MAYTTIYNDPHTRAKFVEPWVYWDGTFTDEELEKIVMYCEQFEMDEAITFAPQIDKDYRVSNVKFCNRNDDTAWIFDKLNFVIQSANEIYYNFNLNGYSEFQYTTYDGEKNGNYNWHMDMPTGKSFTNQPSLEQRKLSLTLLLNDSFEGGEFYINPSSESMADLVPTKKGRIILFPSFMCHKVAPVTKGMRRSLVIWVVGPKFT